MSVNYFTRWVNSRGCRGSNEYHAGTLNGVVLKGGQRFICIFEIERRHACSDWNRRGLGKKRATIFASVVCNASHRTLAVDEFVLELRDRAHVDTAEN